MSKRPSFFLPNIDRMLNFQREFLFSGVYSSKKYEKDKNLCQISHYTKLTFLPLCIFYFFQRPLYIWYLVISILQISNPIIFTYNTILPLLFFLFFTIFKEFFLNFQKIRKSDSKNFKKCHVWKGICFEETYKKDLNHGQIILLKESDEVPADLLLIASGNIEKKCFVNSVEVTGEINLQRKETFNEIQALIDSLDVNEAGYYLNSIEGIVSIDDPSIDFNELNGKVKIKNSPKSVHFNINNVLLQGSVIKASTWVFGLVLYVGKETKTNLNSMKKIVKKNRIEGKIEKLLKKIAPLVLFFTIFHFLLSIFLGKDPSSAGNFFSFLVLYTYLFPFPIFFIFDVCLTYLAYESSKKNPNIKINCPEVIPDLGQIEYMILEKNGNLAQNNLKVKVCFVDEVLFNLESFSDYGPADETNFGLNEGVLSIESLQKLTEEKNSNVFNFLRCLAICNNVFPQEAEEYLTSSQEDRAIISLARETGIWMMRRDSKKITLHENELEHEYKILAYRDFTHTSKKQRIIVEDQEKKFFYYVRSSFEMGSESIPAVILGHIKNISVLIPGIRVILFSYRELNHKEVHDFNCLYNDSRKCPVNREGRIEAVFEGLEQDLTFLGFVGLEDKVSLNIKKTFNEFQASNIKTWIISADTEENTFSIGLGSEIIDKSSELLRIYNTENLDEIIFLLEDAIRTKIFFEHNKFYSEGGSVEESSQREDLENLHNKSVFEKRRDSEKSLDVLRRTSLHPLISMISNIRSPSILQLNRPYNAEAIDYVLVMDGEALSLAMTNEESLKLIVIVLFLSKSVCFFNMLPHHKKNLAALLKKCFAFEPVFMSVAGKSDLGLCNESNIGINKDSDICVDDINDLKSLILYFGSNIYVNSCKVVLICFCMNFSLVTLYFIFFYICAYSAGFILFEENLIICILGFESILLMPILIFDESIDNNLALTNFQIYYRGNSKTLGGFSKVFRYLFLGTLFGSIGIGFVNLTFVKFLADNGKTESDLMINFYLFLYYTIVFQGICLIDTVKISFPIVFSHIMMDILVFLYIIITNYLESHALYSISSIFFSNPLLVLSCIFTGALSVLVFYFQKVWFLIFSQNEYVHQYKPITSLTNFQTRYNTFESNLESVYKKNDIANQLDPTNSQGIDPFFLKFRSDSKEKDYTNEKSRIYRKNYRFYIVIYSLIQAGLFIYVSVIPETRTWTTILLSVSSLILFLNVPLQFSSLFKYSTLTFLNYFYISGEVFTIFSIIFLNNTFSIVYSIYPLFFLIAFGHKWLLILSLCIIDSVLDIYFKTLIITDPYSLTKYSILLISIFLISSFSMYFLEYTKREEFALISNVNAEMQKATNVLELLLPSFVITRVKEGIRYISLDEGTVSVLFCNICDFEEIFEGFAPHELTGFLDELFGKFDQLCEIVGVTKIETVGKTYMASAGLKDSDSELDLNLCKVNHARRVVELGIGILRIISKVYARNTKVHVKIGINSGPVRAGVVGYHKPQFSLVGDTVNIASRMASTLAVYDSIQISKSTYDLISEGPGLSFVSQTSFVKGKGNMETFIVNVKPPDNNSLEFSPINDTIRSSLRFQHISAGFLSTYSSLPGINNGPDYTFKVKNKKKTLMDERWTESLLFKSKASDVLGNVKLFSLSFFESRKEEKFRKNSLKNTFNIFYQGIATALLANFCMVITEIVYVSREIDSVKSFGLWIFGSQFFMYLGILIILQKYYQSLIFGLILQVVYFYPIPLIILEDLYDEGKNTVLSSLQICFQLLLLTQCSILLFKHISLFILLSLIPWLIYTIFHASLPGVICFFFLLISLLTVFHKEIKLRVYSNLKSKGEKELIKIEQLLTQMVPPHAYEHLKQENSVIDKFFQVTLLYADIVGFTSWSSDKTPDEVVSMLSEMFSRFDKLCVEHSVYKVHTIGDCYVAMSHIGAKTRDPSQEGLNIIGFAKAMLRVIQDVNAQYSMGINMRIGVHTGDVIAGVTGKNIVRYDIYGNDVFIANSMESNGISGRIALSQATVIMVKAFRPSLYQFEPYKIIEVLGNPIQIYLLFDNPEEQ